MQVIQIYGVERSGTNYLQWLLVNNFKDLIVSRFNKHGDIDPAIKHTFWDKKPTEEELKSNIDGYNIDGYDMEAHLLNFNKKSRINDEDIYFSKNFSYNGPLGLECETHEDNTMWLSAPSPFIIEQLRDNLVKKNIKFIIIVKNPYTTIVSMLNKWSEPNYRYKCNEDVIHWNMNYKSFVNFYEKNPKSVILIKYEDLICNLDNVLNKIKEFCNLESNFDKYIDTNDVVLCNMKLAPKKEIQDMVENSKSFLLSYSPHIKGFNKSYILKNKHLLFLSEEGLEIINKKIDKDLLKYFEYNFISENMLKEIKKQDALEQLNIKIEEKTKKIKQLIKLDELRVQKLKELSDLDTIVNELNKKYIELYCK